MLYSTGQGGAPLDFVSAHMLFNLAAMRGSQEAKIYRKELSREMDPADVAEAQRQARQWLAEGLTVAGGQRFSRSHEEHEASEAHEGRAWRAG